MKKLFSILVVVSFCLTGQAQELKHSTGKWDPDSLGNHRILVEVGKDAKAVHVSIPWRRKDVDPPQKEVIIISAKSGKRITNLIRVNISREKGDFIFEPIDGKGEYYFYYLPYIGGGRSNYPTVTYRKPQDLADAGWKEKSLKENKLPKAKAIEAQAISELHSFFPMEIIATSEEYKSFLKKHQDKNFLLFPEDRYHPIRMWDDLPYRWVSEDLKNKLSDHVQQGEYYAFQLGLLASKIDIEDIDVVFSDFVSTSGKKINSDAFSCFQKGGIDWTGEPLVKKVPVKKGKVQPLWMGVMIPETAAPGKYTAKVNVTPKGQKKQTITLELEVKEGVIPDHGDDNPESHSRLRWLDSQIAEDNGVIDPYSPLVVENNTVKLLGRELAVNKSGLPEQIIGKFTQEMTGVGTEGRNLLAEPMHFQVETAGKTGIPVAKSLKMGLVSDGRASWQGISETESLKFITKGFIEFDGFLSLKVDVVAKKSADLDDISYNISLENGVGKYMLGLGRKGGFAPDEFQWKWDPYFNNDGPWIGDLNLGLQSSFRDENYERPLNTNFYHEKPLKMPPSWYNDGKGGINMERSDGTYSITAYSGKRQVEKGDTLHFNIQFLITPFRSIDTESQWQTRYYHKYEPIDSILEYGGNTINVHHATDINPYINYPFMTPKIMKEYIDEAHEKNAKVKIYYTVRELSNICPEIWALKSLGDEILSYGPGGGYSWLQEHLDGNYIGAWFVPDWKDAAIINSGVSRWHNYYLEGLNWLVNNVGIDGLYIDDVAFDRSIMKRVRKILQRGNPGSMIDLHSANQFNPRDGFANSANLYMEHFAYLDRLWFGEYFDYNAGPEYWLTEVSGIPFGLMGEMLQDGGNRWRGMIYGMTSRAPWSGDPSAIWKLWDEFGIEDSKMIGYWVDDCPVKTGRPDILATVYKKKDKVLVALASWADGPARVELKIDWEALGMDPAKVKMIAPAVKDYQEETKFALGESFQVPAGKGYLIVIK